MQEVFCVPGGFENTFNSKCNEAPETLNESAVLFVTLSPRRRFQPPGLTGMPDSQIKGWQQEEISSTERGKVGSTVWCSLEELKLRLRLALILYSCSILHDTLGREGAVLEIS